MVGLKQPEGSKICVAVVIAMAVGCSVKEVEDNAQKASDGSYYLSEAMKFLLSKGYGLGIGFNAGEAPMDTAEVHEDTTLQIFHKVAGCPAMVTVRSKNYRGKSHAVYWDGKNIYDPSPRAPHGPLPLSEYKDVISWYPIYKWEPEE